MSEFEKRKQIKMNAITKKNTTQQKKAIKKNKTLNTMKLQRTQQIKI